MTGTGNPFLMSYFTQTTDGRVNLMHHRKAGNTNWGFIDRNLNPKKIKKHPKTDVYSTLPACHECTAVN
ncbi:hypothetical protein ECJB195_A0035 [Escherichia coli JB1-95]|nr:hypothetical protein ECJB195_A0035 [Escherichia coli JB1-95]